MRGKSGNNLKGAGNWRPSYPFVVLLIVLVGAAAVVVGIALDSDAGGDGLLAEGPNGTQADLLITAAPIDAEAAPFRGAAAPVKGAPAPSARHLEDYYALRAYPGAPPTIPHEVDESPAAQAQACNQCHQAGGYVARFKAFTPITPHPEYLSCRQCHVTQQNQPAFKPNRWVKVAGPKLGRSALPGGPPRIPHSLQLRGNCVACHSGGGAVAEIATSHPERGNCRQCHVPSVVTSAWSRP